MNIDLFVHLEIVSFSFCSSIVVIPQKMGRSFKANQTTRVQTIKVKFFHAPAQEHGQNTKSNNLEKWETSVPKWN